MASPNQVASVETAIHWIRRQRIMLDSDPAKIYGVTVRRLNEQLRRNRKRFPIDFSFQLAREELANLKSQIATSSLHGGKRNLPWGFTEYGAIMLASVLNSDIAIEASLRVVRAFVRLREIVSANRELAAKFAELEHCLDGHDESLANLFAAIRQLPEPPQPEKKREVGFHVRETASRYGNRKKKGKV